MAAALPVPVRLLHRNELDDDLRSAVATAGAPVVLARVPGGWRELLGAAELDRVAGSVTAFEAAVRARLDEEATA